MRLSCMMPRNFYKKISKGFESNVIDMTELNIFGLHGPIGNKGLQPCRELLNMGEAVRKPIRIANS